MFFCAVSPELAQVVVPGLAVRGARDAHGEARLQLPQLQQHDGQVVDEEQRVHQGHSVLHDALVVLVLEGNDREEGRGRINGRKGCTSCSLGDENHKMSELSLKQECKFKQQKSTTRRR